MWHIPHCQLHVMACRHQIPSFLLSHRQTIPLDMEDTLTVEPPSTTCRQTWDLMGLQRWRAPELRSRLTWDCIITTTSFSTMRWRRPSLTPSGRLPLPLWTCRTSRHTGTHPASVQRVACLPEAATLKHLPMSPTTHIHTLHLRPLRGSRRVCLQRPLTQRRATSAAWWPVLCSVPQGTLHQRLPERASQRRTGWGLATPGLRLPATKGSTASMAGRLPIPHTTPPLLLRKTHRGWVSRMTRGWGTQTSTPAPPSSLPSMPSPLTAPSIWTMEFPSSRGRPPLITPHPWLSKLNRLARIMGQYRQLPICHQKTSPASSTSGKGTSVSSTCLCHSILISGPNQSLYLQHPTWGKEPQLRGQSQ